MIRRASCCCGQLGVTCEGEPVRVSMCHCLTCQKRSGSVFAVQARFPRASVTFEGKTREYARVGDEGRTITFRFCPECGSTVWYTIDDDPELVAVAVGAFGDPTLPAPTRSVYGTRRHPWVEIPASVVERWDD